MFTFPTTFWGGSSITPPPMTNMKLWIEADYGVTKAYSTTNAGLANGTVSTFTFTSSGDISYLAVPGTQLRINSTDVYTVASRTIANPTVVTLTTPLVANYTNSQVEFYRISQILDRSGLGNTAITGSGSYAFNQSSTNGRSSILSDLTSNTLNITNTSGIYALPTAPSTVFFVGKTAPIIASAGANFFSEFGADGMNAYTGLTIGYYPTSDNTASYSASRRDYNGGALDTTASATRSIYNTISGQHVNSSQAILTVNGTPTTNNTAFQGFNPSTITEAYIGGFIGELQAILAYNTILSAPNLALVNTYLKTKYSTP